MLCLEEEFPTPLGSEIYRKIQQRVREEILEPLEITSGRIASGRGGCLLEKKIRKDIDACRLANAGGS